MTVVPSRPITIPAERRRAARAVERALASKRRVVMTTHVNADGDGLGSQVALWHLLHGLGIRASIANPTRIPERYNFLFRGARRADCSDKPVAEIRQADAIVVLDISELSRIGYLAEHVVSSDLPVICIDHHVSRGTLPDGPRLIDPKAAATGELIHDLAVTAHWPITKAAARALYVALLTDTGGFRFSNTSPRALQVAAHLLELGVRPEEIYADVYSNVPEARVRLTGEVLETLMVEPEPGLAWLTVPAGALSRHGAQADDLDGVVEFARSIRGVRLALLFRHLANGRIKVSFRSVGPVDVARLAHRFGGGGHKKASGASLEGSLEDVQARVLEAARAHLGPRS